MYRFYLCHADGCEYMADGVFDTEEEAKKEIEETINYFSECGNEEEKVIYYCLYNLTEKQNI